MSHVIDSQSSAILMTCIVKEYIAKRSSSMLLCIIMGYGTRGEESRGVGIARMPSIITNQGEEEEERFYP